MLFFMSVSLEEQESCMFVQAMWEDEHGRTECIEINCHSRSYEMLLAQVRVCVCVCVCVCVRGGHGEEMWSKLTVRVMVPERIFMLTCLSLSPFVPLSRRTPHLSLRLCPPDGKSKEKHLH